MAKVMQDVQSIKDIVNLWPTRAALVADIKAVAPDLPVTLHQAHKWAEKNTIPARYHYAVLLASRARGFAVSAEQIVRFHAPAGLAA